MDAFGYGRSREGCDGWAESSHKADSGDPKVYRYRSREKPSVTVDLGDRYQVSEALAYTPPLGNGVIPTRTGSFAWP